MQKIILRAGLVVFIACVINILILTTFFTPSLAANPKKELSKVKKKLEEEKRKIKEALKKERSILSELEDIEKAIKEKDKELRQLSRDLSRTRNKIKTLNREISKLKDRLTKRGMYLKERLRALYKQQIRGDIAIILISAKDYQDLLKKSRYISLIAYHDSRLINRYSTEIKRLDLKKREMETLKKELRVNKEAIREKLDELKQQRKKKDKLLALIRSKRTHYEKMIRELEESSKKLNAMIKEMEKKRRALKETGRTFKALKGRLPWPVNGEIVVPFGKYRDPKFNILVFKNGVEIKSKKGEYVRAIHDGRVVYADWFKGYGQLIIISHGGGYHSLYGNLSEIFYKTGDIIKRGKPVGRVGHSGLSDTPTLYFEIRYKGKPVDPTRWLKKKVPGKKV
jgi:septal ring factor EnvC (AmiA/AmiB activator)